MPLSSKLCFVGVEHGRTLRVDADARKQSFRDTGVTKLELGHEGACLVTRVRALRQPQL